MKISELVDRLQKIAIEHGDVEVTIDGQMDLGPIEHVEVNTMRNAMFWNDGDVVVEIR